MPHCLGSLAPPRRGCFSIERPILTRFPIIPRKLLLSRARMKIPPCFFGAPGRAHSLGGESPLHTRQGEVLAEPQGCPSRGGIRRKRKAKRWPDEQEADRGGAAG